MNPPLPYYRIEHFPGLQTFLYAVMPGGAFCQGTIRHHLPSPSVWYLIDVINYCRDAGYPVRHDSRNEDVQVITMHRKPPSHETIPRPR